MNTGTPPRAENKETLDFLLEELGEECQRMLELLNKLKGKQNGKIKRNDILAELNASIVHLRAHTKRLPNLIYDEFDREEDDCNLSDDLSPENTSHRRENQKITVEEFFTNLTHSMQRHSQELRNGQLFLPEHLKERVFTRTFDQIVDTLAKSVSLNLEKEIANEFPEEYGLDCTQRIDYVFRTEKGFPQLYLELESLDGAQLMRFSDGAFNSRDEWNKLWYYYGTLGRFYTWKQPVPRFFVSLMILPERKVTNYHIWDTDRNYQLLPPELKTVAYENPYLFYDHQIKALARAFLRDQEEFFDSKTRKWKKKTWKEYQEVCELVFITCTIDRLILSRGRDFFDRDKEITAALFK